MACTRCRGDVETSRKGWCRDCESAYDIWVRRHAADIVWQVLAGGTVIALAGMGLPLLGYSWVLATTGAFAGFGTLVSLSRWTTRRRRRQFLQAPLPRAYLPSKT